MRDMKKQVNKKSNSKEKTRKTRNQYDFSRDKESRKDERDWKNLKRNYL